MLVGGKRHVAFPTMHLLPNERDKLQVREVGRGAHQIGFLAQQRLARGTRLNKTEALALLSVVLHEHIRDGTSSVAALMQHGKTILGYCHVRPGVAQTLCTSLV